jgi:hypothetical protein
VLTARVNCFYLFRYDFDLNISYFCHSVDRNGKKKWEKVLGLEENHFKWSFEDEEKDEIPAIFKILSGPKDPEKIKLANTVLVDWQVNLKKKVKKSKKRKSEEEEEEKEEKKIVRIMPQAANQKIFGFFFHT